jgi:hypothetical protein
MPLQAGYFLWTARNSRSEAWQLDFEKESDMAIDPGIAVARRNTEEVQGRGNFDVFEELFAIDFVDHTLSLEPLPPTRRCSKPCRVLRSAFQDLHAEIHCKFLMATA